MEDFILIKLLCYDTLKFLLSQLNRTNFSVGL